MGESIAGILPDAGLDAVRDLTVIGADAMHRCVFAVEKPPTEMCIRDRRNAIPNDSFAAGCRNSLYKHPPIPFKDDNIPIGQISVQPMGNKIIFADGSFLMTVLAKPKNNGSPEAKTIISGCSS